MNSRRLIVAPEAQTSNGSNLREHSGGGLGPTDVAKRNVRFTPKSDIKCDIVECPLWANSGRFTALNSLQQVQVVTIRVFETDHTGTPGLVLRRIVELHASRSQRRIECINIRHGQADVIDARWIAEQA